MNQWQQKMKRVISELLETMFFMPVDFESEGSAAAYGLESRVDLARKMQKISIHLRVTAPFARAAAANFLGADEEQVTWSDLEDVVKEMTNMIGGSYMTQLEQDLWSLGIPVVARLGNEHERSVDGLSISHLGEPVGLVYLC